MTICTQELPRSTGDGPPGPVVPNPYNTTPRAALFSPLSSQQLQAAGDAVDEALGGGPDAEHGEAAGVDLGAAGVLDDLGGDAEAARGGLQRQQLLLRPHLRRDLGLAVALPAAEDVGGWIRGGGGG